MKKKQTESYQYGHVTFEIIGGLGERFFDACMQKDIFLEEIRPTQSGFTARVALRDYKKLHKIARVYRCRLRVRERKGFSFWIAPYQNRTGILIGIIFAVFVLNIGKQLIWDIDFYDFTYAQEQQLRTQLYQHGIYEGAVAKEDRLDDIAKEIFLSSEEYSWVRLNFVQGRLVAEKINLSQQPDIEPNSVSDVVAKADGVILRQVIDEGFAQKTKGQSVAQGEVLISGSFESETGTKRLVRSHGQILAQVEKTYVYLHPLQKQVQTPTGAPARYQTLLLPGQIALPLFWGDIPQDGAQTVTRTPVAPFGFHLPATLESVEVRQMQTVTAEYSPEFALKNARSKVFDSMHEEFDVFQLVSIEETPEQTQQGLKITFRVRFVTDIGEEVVLNGLP